MPKNCPDYSEIPNGDGSDDEMTAFVDAEDGNRPSDLTEDE